MESSAIVHRLVVVGEDQTVRGALREAFSHQSIELQEVESASEALSILRSQPADVVLADLVMPGMGGLDLLKAARSIDPSVGFILFASAGRTADAIEGLRRGADDYIVKPFDLDEIRHAVHRTLHHRQLSRQLHSNVARVDESLLTRTQSTERMLLDALRAIASAVETRDGYGGQHVERVAQYAVATGRTLGLEDESLRTLHIAALLHDLGKIGVPDQILHKPERLTSEEDEVMRRHPVISASIVGQSESLSAVVPAILHYHERWDGGGYPDGLAGEDIPIASRILGVAEAFDAIVTTRPYRTKRTRSEAISELQRCAGAQFDARVVDAFIRSFPTIDGNRSGDSAQPKPGLL